MYKLHTNMFGETIVEKIGENKFFKLPTEPDSDDAQAYLKWVAEGNQPLPANSDFANFKAQINADEAQLQDADGELMTAEQAKQFVKELP